MNKFKLLLKRVLPCLLVFVGIFTLSSCKPKNYHKIYPDVTPSITNPNDAFIQIGNYKVSNLSVYNHLLSSYGLTELQDWIDNIILKEDPSEYDSHYTEEGFNLNLEQIIYGVDENDSEKSNKDNLTPEEQAETLAKFEEDMRALGYFTKEEYTAYYKLEYRRMSFAVNAFKQFVKEYNEDEENKENYFTDEAIKNQYESLHRPTYEIILLTFDSEKEAKSVMAEAGISLDNLNANWKINGADATAASLKAAFENMANISGKTENVVKTYKYAELQKISNSIASKVSELKVAGTEAENLVKSYTHGPVSYGSRYYLALKLNETNENVKAFDELTEAEKDEVVHSLVENSLSTSYIDKVLNEERNKLSLKIYDQGLETKYVVDYKKAYTDLSIETYDEYKVTYDESDSIVAEFKFNDKTYKLTAQELFEKLAARYDSVISLLLVQQYVVLTNYNKVYDYVNNKVLDQTKYDEYYKTDVQKYKTSFEQGNYEENGYPAAYGWTNFLRDYLGVTNEIELMTNLDSSLYNAAVDAISRTLWTTTKEETNEDGETVTVEDDQLVQDEIRKMISEYFSANIIGVMAYYDKDLDGVADDYLNGTDTDSLSEELINKIYELAEAEVNKATDINKTYEKALTQVVNSYKVAAPNHNVWGKFKLAGLRASVITSTSYNVSSKINSVLKTEIKTIWDKISSYDELKDEEGNVIGVKLTGNTLDPGYRYEKNDKAYYLTLKDFTSNVFFTNKDDEPETYNTAYRISVIKASAPSYTNSSKKLVDITLSEYDAYISTGSSTKSSAINYFYKGAISNLLSINGVANAKTMNEVLNMTLAQLENTTITSRPDAINKIKKLIEDTMTTEETK